MEISAHICPHLRLAGDPKTRWLIATPEHRCYRPALPARIREERQAEICLSGRHKQCPAALGDEPAPQRGTDYSAAGAETRSKGMVSVRTGLLAEAVVLLVFTILFISAPSSPVDASPQGGFPIWVAEADSGDRVAGPISSTEVGAPPSLAMAGIEAQPATMASPSSSSGASPGAAATATASGPAGGGRVQVVTEGDTLWSLSRAFGVTVEEIMNANGLMDRNVIQWGQRLVIPDPAR